MPLNDDPRVASELAAAGVDSSDYRTATRAYTYRYTAARQKAARDTKQDANDRFDQALADTALIVQLRPQVQGTLTVATRRQAKAQHLLEQARANLATFPVGTYIIGVTRGSAVDGAVLILVAMTVTVVLTDELAERVECVAAERGVEPDALARELIESQLPAPRPTRRRIAFAGMGHSGQHDLASTLKQIRRDTFAAKTAEDV